MAVSRPDQQSNPPLRAALLGPARRRDGLGPFFARYLEDAGVAVTAVAGSEIARTAAAAAEFAREFGHPVTACRDVLELCAEPVDALVIAAPNAAHLLALRTALARRLAVLCEKPLVEPGEHHLVPELVAGFVSAGVPLLENCQWPNCLEALFTLHPQLRGAAIQEIGMLLSPSGIGRTMLVDSLSHFVSVLQALLPITAATSVTGIAFHGAGPTSERLTLDCAVHGPFAPVRARLWLERAPDQPRPAALVVNGCRIDREIRQPGYRIVFRGQHSTIEIADPLRELVYGFARFLREPNRDRIRTTADAIVQRARLFERIVAAHDARTGP